MIAIVSYNARYAKYREVKKATFPVFEPFSAVWLHLGLCGLFEPGFALVIIFCCYKFCFICFSISIQTQSFFIRSPFVFIIMIFSRRDFLFTVHIGFANTIKKLPASICLSDSVCQEFQSFICVK